MAIDWTATSRGAAAGVIAAGVWAAQMPLDKRVFDSDYDDVELLGKAIVGERHLWYPAGLAAHLATGALFGAGFALAGQRVTLPLPPWARGPLAALTENLATWPLAFLSDRYHPQRDDLPELFGDRRALAQSTWRHLLFGVVFGELERRLNPPDEDLPPTYEAYASPNGHGSIEHAAAAGAAGEAQ
jgi:hypothetical protein